MAELRGLELPTEIIEVYKQAINDAGEGIVLNYAKHVGRGLLKGLRPIKQNVPQIKRRLVQQFAHGRKISAEQLIVLRHYRPLDFFEGFSFEMIDGQLSNLCAVYGRNQVLASLLLDERERVYTIAEGVIREERVVDELTATEIKKFAGQVRDTFGPFFDPLMAQISGGISEVPEPVDPPLPAKEDPRLKQQNERIQALKKKLEQLTGERKQLKKKVDKLGPFEKQLAGVEKDKHRLVDQVEGLKQQLVLSEKQHVELKEAIASTVDDSLQSSLYHWIKKPKELERECKAMAAFEARDLLARAASVIKSQEEVDRHAGNRRILIERFEQLTDLKEQIEQLSIAALNPLKELRTTGEELGKEISRIGQLLEMPSLGSKLTTEIKARLGTAATLDELSEHKSLLENMQRLGILPHADIQDLFVYCDARMSLEYEKWVPTISTAKVPDDPLHRLKRRLHENVKMLWVLDGHNILFQLTDLFGTFDEHQEPTEVSRRALSDLLVKLTKNSNACSVRLYFDGPEYAEYALSEQVKVIYSGGEGDHRADDAICRDLEYHCYQKQKIPIVVTTDDRGLRERVGRLGADFIWVNEFNALARSCQQV